MDEVEEGPRTLLDGLALMRRLGWEIPPELLEAAKLQERMFTDGLSSADTMRYVRLLDAAGVLPERHRYLLNQPLAATPAGALEDDEVSLEEIVQELKGGGR